MKKNYTLLHNHTYYSLLDSPSKPTSIAKRVKELGMSAIAHTDHGGVSVAIEFSKACKDENIKAIHGIELYLSQQDPAIHDKSNRSNSHLVVLSKNLKGWCQLVKLVSKTNEEQNFYYKPRTNLEGIKEFADGNLIAFSGHPGSDLADCLFTDFKAAYNAKTIEEAASCLNPDWESISLALANKYQDIFGKGNFFLEIQNLNQQWMPVQKIIADCLRAISKVTKIPCVATADAHYVSVDNKRDQQIILCSQFKTTLQEVRSKIANDEDVSLSGFFKDSIYHIPSIDEMKHNTEEELQNSNLISDMCESYSLLQEPMLPNFNCPQNKSEIQYLKELCRKEWKNRFTNPDNTYVDRMKTELAVIEKWNLSGYFLIVNDYVQYAKSQGWLVGPGRGSVGGSLIAYTLGITDIDPMKHSLLFERFFNEGRCVPGKTTLPDIDIDFPRSKREHIFTYLKNKYGKDKFAHICTFTALKGKNVLKDVLRVNNSCDFATQNEMTEIIPDEAKIADELQEMRESDPDTEPSILMWTLQNRSKQLAKFVELKDDGSIVGDYATEFKQAIRLEGCKRNRSRHPSAVVLSNQPLAEICPMIYDKGIDECITGYDMYSCEKAGLVKFDILGLNTLDCIMDYMKL